MKLDIQLDAEDLALITSIIRHHMSNVKIWMFGSRIKGTATKNSDCDIALIADNKIPLEKMSLLKESFENSDLSMIIDIIDWNRISQTFQAHIKKNHIEL